MPAIGRNPSGLVSGRLRSAVLREVLADAIAITGALFSLLIAATTFTLVLRLLGTDRLVNNLVVGIPGSDILAVAVVLGVIGFCAFVLDAFEIIFVIVPIVIPPLLIRVADARWVAVLVLLTLQPALCCPVRLCVDDDARRHKIRHLSRLHAALLPFLVAQWMLRLGTAGPKLSNSAKTGTPCAAPLCRSQTKDSTNACGKCSPHCQPSSRNKPCLTPYRARLKTLRRRTT